MSTRRTFLKLGAAAGAGALIRWQLDPTSGLLTKTVRAFASVQTQQTALDGATVLKTYGFAEALPTFVGRRVDDSSFEVAMLAFQQKALPDAFYAGLSAPYSAGTYVRGYQVGDSEPSWPGTPVE